MGKLHHWEGVKKPELRAIPVVVCKNLVTIEGRVENGELVFDPCPACGAESVGFMQMADDVQEEQDAILVSAEISWFIRNGRMPKYTMSVAPTKSALDVIMSVLSTGATYFAHSEMPPQAIYYKVAEFIIRNLLPLKMAHSLMGVVNERLSKQADVNPNNEHYAGEKGGSTKPIEIINIKKKGDDGDDG